MPTHTHPPHTDPPPKSHLPSLERIAPYIQPPGLTPSRESARQSTPKTATAQDRGGGDTPRTRRRENREGKPKPCTMLLPNNAGEKKNSLPDAGQVPETRRALLPSDVVAGADALDNVQVPPDAPNGGDAAVPMDVVQSGRKNDGTGGERREGNSRVCVVPAYFANQT